MRDDTIYSEIRMNKEKLTHLASNLYEQAFWANSYWNLIKQIHEKLGDYYEEINVSPCFYNLTYKALLNAMLMEISKLYDSGNGISLDDLLSSINPDNKQSEFASLVGNTKIKHQVTRFDSCFFEDRVKSYKKVCDFLTVEAPYPVVELNYIDYFDYLKKQFCAVSKSRDKLRKQRNNLLAHNGKDYNFDMERLNKEYPFLNDDVDKLIEYALNTTIFAVEILTGVSKATTSIDIGDWETTLELVRDGQEKRNAECEELLNYPITSQ